MDYFITLFSYIQLLNSITGFSTGYNYMAWCGVLATGCNVLKSAPLPIMPTILSILTAQTPAHGLASAVVSGHTFMPIVCIFKSYYLIVYTLKLFLSYIWTPSHFTNPYYYFVTAWIKPMLPSIDISAYTPRATTLRYLLMILGHIYPPIVM